MVKDIEWLKNEIKEYLAYEGVADARNALEFVLDDIDQLEEPNKVVVPQYVAEYLEYAKTDITFMRVFEIANGNLEWEKYRKEYNWIRENSELFARAWLDGYEVEKEKFYYLKLRDGDLPLYKAYDTKNWKYKLVYSAPHLRNEIFLTVTFSESEIEEMDIRSFELEEVTE